jgi:hypothetical protein
MKKEYTLVPLKESEGKEAVAKLQKFLMDNEIEIVCGPIITPQGTLGAEIKIFRRVELMGTTEDNKFIGDEGEKTA